MWFQLAAALLSLSDFADPPLVVVESKVAQYRAAAAAVVKALPGARELQPGDPALTAALAGAPVVVAVGRKALEVTRDKAKGPVVFCMILGASASDLNRATTGVPMAPDPSQALDKLRELAPKAKRLGVIFDTRDLLLTELQRLAPEKGFVLVLRPVVDSTEVRMALDGLRDQIDALYLPPEPKLYGSELLNYLLGVAAERKLPVIGFLESITQNGALASVSPDYAGNGARAAKLAAELLQRPEAKRLPVPPPVFSLGLFSLNLKTAQALGLAVDPALQLGAKVIP